MRMKSAARGREGKPSRRATRGATGQHKNAVKNAFSVPLQRVLVRINTLRALRLPTALMLAKSRHVPFVN